MNGPVSLVFYLDFTYGQSKGSINQGESVFSSVTGPSSNMFYSSEDIEGEVIGVGAATVFSAVASYLPVVPGSFKVTADTIEGVDNGSGTISGTGISSGTINYATGAIAITYSNPVSAGVYVTIDYRTDFEARGENIGQIDINLTSSPVVARARALRGRWSLIAAQNLQSQFGLNADVEATTAIAETIKQEIDREIIRDLQVHALSGTITFSKTPPSPELSFTEHKLNLEDKFVDGSNLVFRATKRALTNWIVGGTDVTGIVQTLPGFRAESLPSGSGVRRIGQYKQWAIYSDPFMTPGDYVMGYKGTSFFEAGYVYASYIPFVTTPTVTLDDLVSRKGMITQYGKKVVNGRFFTLGLVTS